MNSSLQKALVASMLVVGGAVSAIGQGWDYDAHCIDPNNTAPYSVPYGSYYLETPMWSAGVGAFGTVSWKNCVPVGGPGGSVPVQGRFEFGPGPQGSIQDDYQIQAANYINSPDNLEDFQYGANHGWDPADITPKGIVVGAAPSGSGWSFARIQVAGGADILFGGNGFELAYQGASNRYCRLIDVISTSLTVTLQLDVVADTSHFNWDIQNTGTTNASYGLWVGQWIFPVGGYLGDLPSFPYDSAYPGLNLYPNTSTPVDNYGLPLGYFDNQNAYHPYVSIPGLKPLELQTAILRSTNPSAFPAYVDFTGGLSLESATQGPQVSGGMQWVLSPFANVEDSLGNSDQTPVDEIDFGDTVHLLSGEGIVGDPTFNNFMFPDVSLGDDLAVIQKWYPIATAAGTSTNIIAYYRSIWGDSNYFNGYGAVSDTPKVLAADLSTTSYALNPNPFHIHVDIDNTGFFSQVGEEVPMDSVEVDLSLPPGMYPAGGNPTQTKMVQFISAGISPTEIGSVDFLVAANPDLVGPQNYTVTIKPTPGADKTISGVINVAATPRLQLLSGANLITEPWLFNQGDWGSVLNLNPVSGFQAYNWDPELQEYIPSSGPQREVGSWIVINNPPSGFFNLGGTPSQPTDEFPPAKGASNLHLYQGWNLVGNPYNYSFPLGQLVGVPGAQGSSTTPQTYDQLVSAGILDGSFAYYDPDLQTYDFLGADTDELLPNHGYWVYSSQEMFLVFPPVYDLFDRKPAVPAFKQYANHWKLQMSVAMPQSSSGKAVKDVNNFFGVDIIPGEAAKLNTRKPPIVAGNRAIRAFLTNTSENYNGSKSIQVGTGMSAAFGRRVVRRSATVPEYTQLGVSLPGKHTFNFNVFPTEGGVATVSWPNLQTLPKNIAVEVKDLGNGTSVNARTQAGYNFEAEANTTRTFQVTVDPLSTIRQAISNVTTQVVLHGSSKQMVIGFATTSEGIASLALYQNGQQIATISTDQLVKAGQNSLTWGMLLKNGTSLKPGNYTLSITAVGDGGDTATKYVPLNL